MTVSPCCDRAVGWPSEQTVQVGQVHTRDPLSVWAPLSPHRDLTLAGRLCLPVLMGPGNVCRKSTEHLAGLPTAAASRPPERWLDRRDVAVPAQVGAPREPLSNGHKACTDHGDLICAVFVITFY